MSMTWITFKCQSFQLQVSKLIVTVIHYSVFFYYCKHIGYVFIVSLNVSTQYQHLVFFYKRATMHGKWRVIYRPIFILSLLYRYSCPSVLSILYQLMSEPPHGSARSLLGFYRRVISVVLSGMRGTRARAGQLVGYVELRGQWHLSVTKVVRRQIHYKL